MAHRTRSSIRRLNGNRRKRPRSRHVLMFGKRGGHVSIIRRGTGWDVIRSYVTKPSRKIGHFSSFEKAYDAGHSNIGQLVTFGKKRKRRRSRRVHSNRPMSRRRRSLAAKKGWARRRRSHRRRSRR